MGLEDLRKTRLEKLEGLKKLGRTAYAPELPFLIIPLEHIRKNFKTYARSKKEVRVAGRVMAKREHGNAVFSDLFNSEAKIQIFASRNSLGRNGFDAFDQYIDIGDFIAMRGKAFYTKKKEPTLEVLKWEMLVKTLRALPEKWHGLQDVEERSRRRYLDLLANPEVKKRFLTRSRLIFELRTFLNKEGFVEVETPILQTRAGGASARPFVTHHHALDIDLRLRIATEIHLKQLVVGGFTKVYEIGRIFRNEGIDAIHNPEFTTIELYQAYADREEFMKFIERMLAVVVKLVSKNKKISFKGKTVSFQPPFKKASFRELLERYALITYYEKKTRDDLLTYALRFGLSPEKYESKDKIADKIFTKICAPNLIQPTFVTHYPASLLPLAKCSSENPEFADVFQLFVGGIEIVKVFNELNNPLEQRERFKKEGEQEKLGDVEAQPLDEEFIEALEYGMPPTFGLGIGLDRLAMLLTDTPNIREVILFPTLRPKE